MPIPVSGAVPLIGVPSTPTAARLDAVTSEKCSPNGLIRKRSSVPGISIEKWFEIPSWKSNCTAIRKAAASSMRASSSFSGGFIATSSLGDAHGSRSAERPPPAVTGPVIIRQDDPVGIEEHTYVRAELPRLIEQQVLDFGRIVWSDLFIGEDRFRDRMHEVPGDTRHF